MGNYTFRLFFMDYYILHIGINIKQLLFSPLIYFNKNHQRIDIFSIKNISPLTFFITFAKNL